MDKNNTAFYSTANSGYIEYAATSLLSIRKHVPEAHLFILSSGISDDERLLLNKLKIDFHETDLSSLFYEKWQYPIDCFYMFAGPEFLLKAGYEFSVYIDGDTLCKSNPLLNSLDNIAGVESAPQGGEYTSIFGEDWPIIQNNWNLPDSLKYHKRINSGIIYFNNSAMNDFQLLDKSATLFDICIKLGIPRKGDDSLFSLLQYVYREELKIFILPLVNNYVLQFTDDRIYPIENLVFFHFSIDKPWKDQPFIHTDKILEVYNTVTKEWLNIYKKVNYEKYLELLNLNLLKSVLKVYYRIYRLTKRAIKVSKDLLYWSSGHKNNVVTRLMNSKKDPLKLYWWQDYSTGKLNFGDEITKDIILKVFGYRSNLSTVEDAEIAGAGSILEILGDRESISPLHVWGSGFIQPKNESRPFNNNELFIHSVRGKLSRDRLDLKENEVALGDPGLLANIVYERSKIKSKKVGIVVHYIEKSLPLIDKLRLDPNFVIIDPLDTPESVAKNISACKFILSSSLHGLIFADSFGIPNIHIQFSKKVTGGDYKFKDYYSATGRTHLKANIDDFFDKKEYISSLIDTYEPISNLKSVQKRLIKSFPKNIR